MGMIIDTKLIIKQNYYYEYSLQDYEKNKTI